MSLELRITTLTPICLSSGLSFGAGQEDTQTDLEGHLPIFRGRTLKGLLSEEVAAILAILEPEKGPWHDAAVELFGEPGLSAPAAVSFGNGVLGDGYRTAAGKWEDLVTETLTVTRQQTKIDREKGIPQKGSLRSTRLASAGLVFHFALNEHRTLSDRALVLLAASAASLKRAGLHRNRGWGEIEARLWLDGADQTMSLVKGLKGGKLSIHRTQAPRTKANSSCTRILRVDLTLTSPVVLAKTGSEPSTVETHDFIPGTSILGVLASRWLAANKTNDAAADPAFRKLFLDGTTRYLNAYPMYRNQRYLPVPKTWLREKYKDTPVKDLACNETEAETDEKPITSGFVWLERDEEGTQASHYITEVKTFLHHQRDRELGRATKELGELYSYQGIVAGQTFRSYILCDDESLSEVVVNLLGQGPLSLGRSRSATYGGNAEVKVTSEKTDWSEYSRPEDLDDCDNLTVTLLSDYIGTSDGLANPEALIGELRSSLGLSADVKVSKFIAAGLAGGYVGAWKMPRPTSTTLAAGSVLVFDLPLGDVEGGLRKLEHTGLGTRRAEGFGRLAFGWHGDQDLLPLTKASREERTSSSTESQEFLKVKDDVICHVLGKELRLAAYDQAGLARRIPNPSLLGRVRMRVRTARNAAEVNRFLEDVRFRKDSQGKRTGRLKEAGKSLDSCKIEGTTLLAWLTEWADGNRGWPTDVTTALRRAGFPEDAGKGDWKFVKIFLDAFLESLRRRRKREATK